MKKLIIITILSLECLFGLETVEIYDGIKEAQREQALNANGIMIQYYLDSTNTQVEAGNHYFQSRSLSLGNLKLNNEISSRTVNKDKNITFTDRLGFSFSLLQYVEKEYYINGYIGSKVLTNTNDSANIYLSSSYQITSNIQPFIQVSVGSSTIGSTEVDSTEESSTDFDYLLGINVYGIQYYEVADITNKITTNRRLEYSGVYFQYYNSTQLAKYNVGYQNNFKIQNRQSFSIDTQIETNTLENNSTVKLNRMLLTYELEKKIDSFFDFFVNVSYSYIDYSIFNSVSGMLLETGLFQPKDKTKASITISYNHENMLLVIPKHNTFIFGVNLALVSWD